MTVASEAAALELELARIYRCGGVLLNADAFDRWGPKDDPVQREAIDREASDANRQRADAITTLEREVARLFASQPAVVEAWADAHIALLDEFLTRVSASTTEAFVARKERDAWLEVRAGTRVWVDQNTFYVAYDPALYQQTFGFRR